ncbi:hypothetical protein COM81_25560, partial [Priestia megaterium]|uniref:hypothetical protein n=1 Tax=Priestia megaterium TaxID=1404 RepID=UPI000BED61E3
IKLSNPNSTMLYPLSVEVMFKPISESDAGTSKKFLYLYLLVYEQTQYNIGPPRFGLYTNHAEHNDLLILKVTS